MNVDYVRQVAAECDDLGLRLFDESHDETVPVHIAKAARLLAQAGALLHLVSGPQIAGERLNGSGTVADTSEAPERPQRTEQDEMRVFPQRAPGLAARTEIDELRDHVKDGQEEQRLLIEENERLACQADDYRKRWHEAATQRDVLAKAAMRVTHLSRDDGAMPRAIRELGDVLEELEDEVVPEQVNTGNTLRRELWHVLDRTPAGDDDLIAAVKKLVEVENAAVAVERWWTDWPEERREGVRKLSQYVGAAIDGLVGVIRTLRQA